MDVLIFMVVVIGYMIDIFFLICYEIKVVFMNFIYLNEIIIEEIC